MMRFLLSLLVTLNASFALAQRPAAAWLEAMPDTLLPLVGGQARQALLHAYDLGTEALTHDALGSELRLDTLTADYLRLCTSEASDLQLRLIQTADSVQLAALITSVQTPQPMSTIRFFNEQWQEIFWIEFPQPDARRILGEDKAAEEAALQWSQLPIYSITAQADAPIFTFTLSLDALDSDTRKQAAELPRTQLIRWDGNEFITIK